MKRILYSLMILLCISISTKAQLALFNLYGSEKVTFPINGSVFQMDAGSSNTHKFRLAGQSSNNTATLFSLFKRETENSYTLVSGYNNVPITYKACPSGGCADGIRLFDYVGTDLPKGWYRIVIYRQYQPFIFSTFFRTVTKNVVDFGVGDVYFIAGQSNASGFGWKVGGDNTISTNGEELNYRYRRLSRTI
jgi:hypothetical protein